MSYSRIFLSLAFPIYLVSFLFVLLRVRRCGQDPRGQAAGSPALTILVAVVTLVWQSLVALCILGVDRIVFWGRIQLPCPWAAQAAGSLLFAGGLGMAICGAVTLRESFRLGLPVQKTPLVVRGVYRHTRNPVILGLCAYVSATVFLVPSLPMLVSAVSNFIAYHLKVLEEEKYLRSVHGADYEAYFSRVPRYVPRIGAFDPTEAGRRAR